MASVTSCQVQSLGLRIRVARGLRGARRIQKVMPGKVVPVEIEILPSSTLFEAGSSLRLVVQGHELRDYPAFGHSDSVTHGRHRLFTGGQYDSYLALSVVEHT